MTKGAGQIVVLEIGDGQFATSVPARTFRIIVDGVSYDHTHDTAADSKVRSHNKPGRTSVPAGTWVYAPTDRHR